MKSYQCPACNKVSTSADWDKMTEMLCQNREMRRKFTKIERAKQDKWYVCPRCCEKLSKKNIREVQ